MTKHLYAAFVLFVLSFVALHLWTISIAFDVAGGWAAVATLFLPVVSEIFWSISTIDTQPIYLAVVGAHAVIALLWYVYLKR